MKRLAEGLLEGSVSEPGTEGGGVARDSCNKFPGYLSLIF